MPNTPYVQDDTRKWVEAYRVNNLIKPAFVFRAATDANYINDQRVQLPAYNNAWTNARSICNIISPGQRLSGCLNWQVTESLDNITQTAQLTLLDALPQSKVTGTVQGFGVGTKFEVSTDFTGQAMVKEWHSTKIRYTWVRNGVGDVVRVSGNVAINQTRDPTLVGNIGFTQYYQETNVKYRLFEPEIIQMSTSDLANFPNPAVPYSENEGSYEWWDLDSDGTKKGVGAYYVLINNEVMRVTRIDRNVGTNGNGTYGYLFVIPGGRGTSGVMGQHSAGTTVTLLGFPPFNSQWTALGYLMPKDHKVIQSPFRPGSCFMSYEGYGNPGNYTASYGIGPFSPVANANIASSPFWQKDFDRNNNMVFTGYWFATTSQVTFDSGGVPQLSVTFQSPGYLLSEQKIDPNNVQRSTNLFGSWAKTTFDEIGYDRKIPGDWHDYDMWDTTLPGSYPLTISTEFAQHKAFMDHMNDTDSGRTCEFCQAEWIAWVKNHEHNKPTGSIAEARAVGKHIYKESIRVFQKGGQFNAGPLKTFGRLMHALAFACWDNPQQGDELGTRWTKIPNRLHTSLNCWENGRVWNGQLAFEISSGTQSFDWSNSFSDDQYVYGKKVPLKCAFTTQYDRQPWSQPMQDLADLNRMTYTISRQGYPVFMPMGRKLRGHPSHLLYGDHRFHGRAAPEGTFADKFGNDTASKDTGRGEWHLAYGGSIDSYSTTLDTSSLFTLVYVSCQTAFGDEISFTMPCAGTGYELNADIGGGFTTRKGEAGAVKLVMYSNLVGNKEGLQLTSGAQQSDAVSLDNVLLGLDWNTEPASWGLTLKRGPDGLTQVDSKPPMPIPKPNWNISKETKDSKDHPKLVTQIQKLMNFMLERRYIGDAVYTDNTGTIKHPISLNEDGKFHGNEGKALDSAIKQLQKFLVQQSDTGNLGVGYSFSRQGNGDFILTGQAHGWQDHAGQWGIGTAKAINLWMTANQEYVKTDIWWYVQNGLPWDQYVAAITNFPIPQDQIQTSNSGGGWQIDQIALKTEAQEWMKQFFTDALNYGNNIVDDSINKAFQKVVTSNLADPRIELGDVIWADVPGYHSSSNAFGDKVAPFVHGIYVTGITRTLDLQQGTFQGSYQGSRYKSHGIPHASGPLDNFGNYVSTKNSI